MVELCLVGEPCIAVEGERREISPRASLELLALIALRYPAPISRTECTDLLFAHIEELSGPAAARQQFRIVLSKLRRALSSANLESQVLLDGEDLRLTTPWKIDIHQPVQATSLQELRTCFQPVAPHWDHDRWLSLRTEYADRLAQRLLELFEIQRKRVRPHSDLAKQFHDLATLGGELFPLEPGFVRVLVTLAEIEGNSDRAALLRAEFASRWTSQFPSQPVPASLERSATAHPTGVRSRRAVFGGVVAMTTLMLFAALYARGRTSSTELTLQIEQLPTARLEIEGRRYTLRKYRLPFSEPPFHIEARSRTDGQGFLLLYNQERQLTTPLDGAPVRVPKPWTYDFGGVRFRKLTSMTDAWSLVENPQVRLVATPDYPRVSMPFPLGGNLFFTQRICGHTFGCHYECFYLRDGKLTPLLIDGVKPQTVMLNFADETHVYGMYSMGREEGWKYRPFITDRKTLETRNGGEPFAIGRLSDGTWVCSPKVVQVVRGDYVMQDTKETVLVRPDGSHHVLHRNAKWTSVVGDIVVVGVDEPASNDSYTHTEFYDRRGHPIPQLNTPSSKTAFLVPDPERRRMAFIPFNRDLSVREAYVISTEP